MTRALSFSRDHALTARKSPNRRGDTTVTSKGHARHLDGRVALVARALWETDQVKLLAQCARCSVRTAKRYMAGGSLSLAHFMNLLRSDHGDKFLDAFLADAEPKWWRHRKNIQDLAKAKRAALAALKRAEQLEIEFAADD